MEKKLTVILKSKSFKRAVFFVGITFWILTTAIVFDPEPFIKFGYLGVFVFNLFGPGTLLIPTLSQHMNLYILSFVTALGMLFNDSVSYLIGRDSDAVIKRPEEVGRIERSVRNFGPYALFVWSLLPFPYDFVGFIAGYLHFKYKTFAIPTFLGKFVRFLLIGWGVVSILGKS